MNLKTSKKMRGFMCQSTSAAAVCNVSDPRSVIVPRRLQLLDHQNSANNPLIDRSATYSKLARSHSFSSSNSRPLFASSIKKRQDNCTRNFRDHPKPKPILKPPPSLPSSDQIFQVVVMRVSLHCQGCAGKVKKHLTKMEGVTSFSIDLENKMVTVMGHVSPVGVLESISKVKRAEFWPYSTTTTSSTVERNSSAHDLLIK